MVPRHSALKQRVEAKAATTAGVVAMQSPRAITELSIEKRLDAAIDGGVNLASEL
jgi:hypothetical protein